MPAESGRPASPAGAPLVSVIVRTMGRETLRETLASIARQTYPNVEVVLVDARGGGVPEAGNACGSFVLRVCGTGRPLSRSRAANVGLESAKGHYAIFLDDDDWFYPEHVARLVAALKGSPGARVAYAGIEFVEVGPDGSKKVASVSDYPYDACMLLYSDYLGAIHAALFELSLHREGCRFDERLDVFEDWDFWVELSLRTPFIHVPGASAGYRSPGASRHWDPSAPWVIRDRRTLCEKWRQRWSTDQLLDLLAHARSRLTPREGEALVRRIKELENGLRDERARGQEVRLENEALKRSLSLRKA